MVERYIKFVNFSLNYVILKETFPSDLNRYYIDYEQYDYLNNQILKREPYLEARIVGENKLQVEFPKLESINNTNYIVLERFKVGYNRSKYTSDFIFPFDQFPFNKTLGFRDIGNIYSVQLILPKTYEAEYFKNNLAIQGFFVDKQVKNLSGINFQLITCLPEHRYFQSGIIENKKIINFPPVYLPSYKDDPCPIVPKEIKVHVLIKRAELIKTLFFVFAIVLLIISILLIKLPERRFELINIALATYIFQQGFLIFSSIERPYSITLWDLTIMIPIIVFIAHKLANDKNGKRKYNKKTSYSARTLF